MLIRQQQRIENQLPNKNATCNKTWLINWVIWLQSAQITEYIQATRILSHLHQVPTDFRDFCGEACDIAGAPKAITDKLQRHGSSCGYWYPEVWPRSEAADTFWAPLAWCIWAHQVLSMFLRRCLDGTAPWHTATQSLRLSQDVIFVPVISLLCRLTAWVHKNVGLSLSPARWHGTQYRDICVILFTPCLFLDDYLRHFSSEC